MNKTITICVIILLLGLTESKKSLKDLINKGISEKRNIEKEKDSANKKSYCVHYNFKHTVPPFC